jgi:hypothetical protein
MVRMQEMLVLGALAACNSGDDTPTTDTDSDTDPIDTDTDPIDTDTDPIDTDTDPIDTDTDTTPPALHSLTFHGEDYLPHAGQMMYFMVKNPYVPAEAPVATTTLTMDAAGIVDLSYTDVMVDGTPYSFVWYADTNADGFCDPDADHVWSLPVGGSLGAPVTADAALVYDHDFKFTLPACSVLNDWF